MCVCVQIVGLTASIGIEKASTVEKAVQSVLAIMANLDVNSITVVKNNLDELEMTVPKPDESMYVCLCSMVCGGGGGGREVRGGSAAFFSLFKKTFLFWEWEGIGKLDTQQHMVIIIIMMPLLANKVCMKLPVLLVCDS